VEELAAVADDLRQLNTDFGLRPYRVFSVVVAWSGGVIGRGLAAVVSETELLPTPLVDLRPVRGTMRTGGQVEEGMATLKEVSPRYTEEDIETLFHQQPLPKGHEGFLEVRMDRRDGVRVKRRRFTVRGVPYRDAAEFDWEVRIMRQRRDRKPDGKLSERTDLPERVKNPLMAEED
jgi:hypothetical protein